MKTLNYEVLEEQKYPGYLLKDAPERVLQFGEGNFMRAFVDEFVDVLNEEAGFSGKVVVVQPRGVHSTAPRDKLNKQEGLYTLILQGFKNGEPRREKRVISSISRCLNPVQDWSEVLECAKNPDLRFITSNTTEAGIVWDPQCRLEDEPPASFPAKLTQLLYKRYQAGLPGFILLPCELIDDNGHVLRQYVLDYARLWKLPEDFIKWVEEENIFCSTLVDRIVTGTPGNLKEIQAENGYEDKMTDTGEVFGVWIIEGPKSILEELPVKKTNLPISVVKDVKPYKQRKVRILNGAHTSMVPGAFLAGENIVRDAMYDPVIHGFFEQCVYNEIIPTLSLDQEDCTAFGKAVEERFKNPYIDHALLSIALNSTAKWKARVMPSLLAYVEKFNEVPKGLATSLANLIAFYHGDHLEEDGLHARRPSNDEEYVIVDDASVLNFYNDHKEDSPEELVHAVLSNQDFWSQDLCELEGLEKTVLDAFKCVQSDGSRASFESCLLKS